jgi:hypothetical protein
MARRKMRESDQRLYDMIHRMPMDDQVLFLAKVIAVMQARPQSHQVPWLTALVHANANRMPIVLELAKHEAAALEGK